ncbi:flagellar biosynthetic protein FliO [Alkalibacterium olivapovliticus]|uniref:Flagellar biogenesis protein FliO n=1 Tax=Alkalibacterium olivapovliticus TaxID=99907 RepID=A0A2T0VYV5_9LACT|nr:flagellar biosynthetic protein FliO [Alkalibacterium olivapovliticus]PRY77513.1 flagellar biogenesis protein FliO [Alkalibacterium olivapovliticus]
MNFIDIIQMIIALVVIVFLANFLLKKLNSIQQPTSQVIKIIERVQVSKSSSLSIVQIESDYLLMSLSETSNEVIKTFTEEEKEAIQKRLARKNQGNAKEWAEKTKPYSNKLIKKLRELKQNYSQFQKKGNNKQ